MEGDLVDGLAQSLGAEPLRFLRSKYDFLVSIDDDVFIHNREIWKQLKAALLKMHGLEGVGVVGSPLADEAFGTPVPRKV